MTSYSFINPVSHTVDRTEFQIPLKNVLIDPDIKLLDVGIKTAVLGSNGDVMSYPENLGTDACIKECYLHINDKPIHQMRLVNQRLGSSELNVGNGYGYDVETVTKHKQVSMYRNRVLDTLEPKAPNGLFVTGQIPNLVIAFKPTGGILTQAGNKGMVSLMDLFPFLRAMKQEQILIHSKYLFLNIVIVWEQDVKKYDNNSVTDITLNSITEFYRPQLMIYKSVDPDELDNFNKVYEKGFSLNYDDWLYEFYDLGTTTNANFTTEYKKDLIVNGNNGSFVNYIVSQIITSSDPIANRPENKNNAYSIANNKEILDLTINDVKYLDKLNKIDNPLLKRHLRGKLIKSQLLPQGEDFASWSLTNANVAAGTLMGNTDSNLKYQSLLQSYYVLPVFKKVDTMSLTYKWNSSQMWQRAITETMYIWSNIAKSTSIKNGLLLTSNL